MDNRRRHSIESERAIDVADGAMLAVVVIWAGNNVLTKSALGTDISPRLYVLLRLLIVSMLLGAWLLARREAWRLPRAEATRIILAGVSGYAVYNLLFVIGLSRTTAFSAAILIAMAPVITLVLSAALGLEPVSPRQWAGVIAAVIGVSVFVGEKLLVGAPALGDLLNLLAALSFSIYSLTTQGLVRRYPSPVVTFWSVTVGLIAVIPFTLTAAWSENWQTLQWRGWTAVVYAAVLSMMVAYTIWGWAIARRGTGRTVPFLFLIPIVTGLLSVLFLDEEIGSLQLVGAGLVLGGVALARAGVGNGFQSRVVTANRSGLRRYIE